MIAVLFCCIRHRPLLLHCIALYRIRLLLLLLTQPLNCISYTERTLFSSYRFKIRPWPLYSQWIHHGKAHCCSPPTHMIRKRKWKVRNAKTNKSAIGNEPKLFLPFISSHIYICMCLYTYTIVYYLNLCVIHIRVTEDSTFFMRNRICFRVCRSQRKKKYFTSR